MVTKTIDLNCDMGEGFGPWPMGSDAAVMNRVSSINIACGFHAGDAATMRQTIALATEHDIAIGAHPGLPDLQGFGRRVMEISPTEAYNLTLYQVGALAAFAKAAGTKLAHVKPHGALYNMAATRPELAAAIARAVKDFDETLILYGLSGSCLISEGRATGLLTASEVFADRAYQSNGQLQPRHLPGAVITDIDLATHQVLQMVLSGRVKAADGSLVPIEAQTICIHGDGPHAAELATAIATALQAHKISIQPPA